jgi:hypothetical protein
MKCDLEQFSIPGSLLHASVPAAFSKKAGLPCIVKLSEPLSDSRHDACIFGVASLSLASDTMRQHHLAALIISFSFSAAASAGDIDTGAVIGGAIGGGAGGGIGSKVGGTSGAVIGGAIGGAAGAAIGSSSTKKEPQKVVV